MLRETPLRKNNAAVWKSMEQIQQRAGLARPSATALQGEPCEGAGLQVVKSRPSPAAGPAQSCLRGSRSPVLSLPLP